MILTDEQLDTLEGKFKRLAKEARIAPPSYEIFLLIAEVRRGRKIESRLRIWLTDPLLYGGIDGLAAALVDEGPLGLCSSSAPLNHLYAPHSEMPGICVGWHLAEEAELENVAEFLFKESQQ